MINESRDWVRYPHSKSQRVYLVRGKMWQNLWQNGAKFITNWDRYYKLGQLLQIAA